MKSESYKISGMTCAACAKAVERAVKKLEGATDVTVNIATDKLAVTYDEAKEMAKEPLKVLNEEMKKISDTFGAKHRPVTFTKIMR